VVILERRSPAGKVMYRSVIGGWNGSEEEKHRLYEQLELLQRDPAYLTSDATLPELNNEMAPVRRDTRTRLASIPVRPRRMNWLLGSRSTDRILTHVTHPIQSDFVPSWYIDQL